MNRASLEVSKIVSHVDSKTNNVTGFMKQKIKRKLR